MSRASESKGIKVFQANEFSELKEIDENSYLGKSSNIDAPALTDRGFMAKNDKNELKSTISEKPFRPKLSVL